jgi:CxxC-x17-CxxC domain-containing protein
MSFQDQTLKCADCGKDFTFTAGEQEFFAQKGFSNTPKRCPDCRSRKKAQSRGGGRDAGARGGGGGFGGGGRGGPRGGGGGRGADRPRYPATCSRCGAAFDAPFQPKQGLPVYCRDCFDAVKGSSR